MPQFLALTSRGLAEPLMQELQELGFDQLKISGSGVYFESNQEGCYKVNLCSRLATRVIKPILDFPAYQQDELYHNIQKHDFTKYIEPHQTLKVESSVSECKIHDQRFVAMKVKDAIVDQFRDKFDVRPNVEKDRPDLSVFIRGVKNQFNVAIDTSGSSLFMRGYREHSGPAPLKEHLAAGLVRLSGWQMDEPIVDPMCGAGTILIEAALMALKWAPGAFKKGFAFQRLKGFQEERWEQLLTKVTSEELEELPIKFYGFDSDRRAIQTAKDNARRAGVSDLIEFKYQPVATLKAPCPKGILITNPPYGARLGEEDELRDLYKDLGHTLKHEFKGWSAWILSGNKDLILDMKLKSTKRFVVFNGGLECRFLKYEMF